jgi:hypothetical protein
MQALGVSQTTMSRALRTLEKHQQVVRIGSTRGARYALRNPIAAIGSQWPVYRIDAEGFPQEIGQLTAIHGHCYHVSTGPSRIAGTFTGLPYYLQDARPAGFLGRVIPNAHPELALPARVTDWTEEHVLIYLTRRGSDSLGDLLVGVEAVTRFLAKQHAPPIVGAENRASAYAEFADAAMAGAPPGSLVHGEHPKFTACVADGDLRTQVIVKFSPPRSGRSGLRWADLLTAEYLAHRLLEEAGIAACRSRLFEHADRVFLECDRFDRVGADGRVGVASLHAVDTHRYGRLDTWTAAAERLAADSLLSAADAETIRLIDAFGALIANTNRHFGNLSLFDRHEGEFALAPIYDMLPMMYAPQDGQLVPRPFEPGPPRAEWLRVWPRARVLAEEYWSRITSDTRISRDFQRLAAQARARVQSPAPRSAGAHKLSQHLL